MFNWKTLKKNNEGGFSAIELMSAMVIFVGLSLGVTALVINTSATVTSSTESTYLNNKVTVGSQIIGKTISESQRVISVTSDEITLELAGGKVTTIKAEAPDCAVTITQYASDGVTVLETSQAIDNSEATSGECIVFTGTTDEVTVSLSTKDAKNNVLTSTITASVGYYNETTDVGGFTVLAAVEAPTNFGASQGVDAVTRNTVALSWDAVTDAQNYILQYSTDNVSWVIENSYILQNSYTVENLVPETTYYFRVAAKSAAGIGSWSESYTATTDFGSVTSKVANLIATPSPTSIGLAWDAPTDNGGYVIDRYTVRYSLDGTNWSTFTTKSTSYSILGLTKYTNYYVQVNASNFKGDSEWQSANTRTLMTAPSAPTGLSIIADENGTELMLEWSLSTDNGGADSVAYTAEYSTNNSTWTATSALYDESSTILTGLNKNTTYYVRVKASNTAGSSSYVTGTEKTFATIPDAPTALTASNIGATSFDLSWTAPVDKGGLSITNYTVLIDTNSNFTDPEITTTSETSLNVTDLTRATNYYIKVYSNNSLGQSTGSASASLMTLKTVTSVVPLLSVSSSYNAGTGKDSAILEWNAPSDNGGATILGYKIYNGTTLVNQIILPAGTTTYTIENLEELTDYTFYVTAMNSVGESAKQTNGLTTRTPPFPPQAPTGLSVSASTTTTLDIEWTNGGGYVANYYVIIDDVEVAKLSPSVTDYQFKGLTAETDYSISVYAENETAASGQANILGYTVPNPVTDFAITDATRTSTTLDVSWTASTGSVTGYKLYSGDNLVTTITNKTVTDYQFTGLSPLTSYTLKIAAYNGSGTNGGSSTLSTATAKTRISAPTNVTAGNITSDSATISWTAPSGGAVDGYKIYKEGVLNATATSAISGTSVNVTGLSSGVTTNYGVSAYAVIGGVTEESIASPIEVLTLPANPATVTEGTLTTSSIGISWTAQTGATGYKVYLDGSNTPVATVSGTSTTISSLMWARKYSIVVKSYNASGTGTNNTTPLVSTTKTAPATGVVINSSTSRSVTVGWTNPTANSGYTDQIGSWSVSYSTNGGTTYSTPVSLTTAGTTSYNFTGLTPNTSYIFKVVVNGKIINAGGIGYTSTQVSTNAVSSAFITAPDDPASISQTASTTTSVTTTWPATTGATSYKVRITCGANYTETTVTSPTVTSTNSTCNGSALTTGTAYNVKVWAVNSGGSSNGYAETTTYTTPSAVTPTVASTTATTATITWTPYNTSTANTAVNGYKIYNSGGTLIQTVTDVSTKTATLTGLTGNTSYAAGTYTVVAYINTTILASGTITGMAGNCIDYCSIFFYATNTSALSDGQTILITGTGNYTTYGSTKTYDNIEYTFANANGSSSINADGFGFNVSWTPWEETSPSYGDGSISGLSGRWEVVGASATTTIESARTNISAFTTKIAAPTLSSSTPTATTTSVTWAAPTGTPTGYKVARSSDNGATWGITDTILGTTILTYNFGGTTCYNGTASLTTCSGANSNTALISSTAYRFKILAYNANGDGDALIVYSNTTPSAPTALNVTSNTTTSITLGWTNPTGGGSVPITTYNLEKSLDNITWTGGCGSYSMPFTSLQSNTRYYFRVSAANGNSYLCSGYKFGPVSSVLSTVTIPDAPTSVTATNPVTNGDTTVNLSFTAPTGNGTITGYTVQQATYSNGSYGAWSTLTTTLTGTAPNYVITGLTSSTKYKFQILATNAGGNSSYSTASELTTLTPPPTGLTASDFTASQLTLAWTPPTGSGTINGYKIEQSQNNSTWSTFGYVDCATSCSLTNGKVTSNVTGLQASVKYFFRVSATNSSGTIGAGSTWGVTSTALDTAAAPAAPTSLALSSGTSYSGPVDLVSDSFGNKYIANINGNNILEVKPSGETVVLAGPSNSASGFANGTGSAARFNSPYGITISPDQNILYVVERSGQRVRAINIATGAVTTIAGENATAAPTAAIANGIGAAARFNDPIGITISPNGTVLYVVEYAGSRIRAVPITANSGAISTVTTTTIAGENATVSPTVALTNGIGTAARFNGLAGITISPDGTKLYVTEYNGQRVRGVQVTANSTATSTVATTTIAGENATAQPAVGYTNGIGTAARFNTLTGITINSGGNVLYVSEILGNRIRSIPIAANSIATSTATTTTVAGDVSAAAGATGTTDGVGTAARFNQPRNLSLSRDGLKLYVADGSNNLTRTIVLSSSSVSKDNSYSSSVLSSSSVSLAWVAPTAGTGTTVMPVTYYKIERSSDAGSTWSTVANNITITSYTDSTASGGVKYLYRVSAGNVYTVGASPSVSSVYGTLSSSTVVDTPSSVATSVSVSSSSPSSMRVQWRAPAGLQSYSTYNVYLYNTDSNGNPTTLNTVSNPSPSSSDTSYTFNGLGMNQKYYVEVRVVTSNTTGVESDGVIASGFTLPDTLLSYQTKTLSSITLNETYAFGGNGAVTITATQAIWDGTSYGTPVASTIVFPYAAIRFDGLSAGTRYQFAVTKTNSAGSTTVTFVESTLAPAPTTPTADNFTGAGTGFRVNITRPATSTTGYKVEVDTVNTFATAVVSYVDCAGICPATSTQTISSLQSNTVYYVRVSATTTTSAVGAGSDWSAVSGTLTTATTPSAPTSVTATNPATSRDTTATLTFTAPTGNGTITGYTVEQNSSSGGGWTSSTVAGTASPLTVTGLTNSTGYQFRVRAVNSSGTSVASSITTTITTLPSAPTGLTATAFTTTGVTLGWTAPASGSAAITGYKLEQSIDNVTWTTAYYTTSSSYDVTGLQSNIIHYFRVTATNSSGSPVAGSTWGVTSSAYTTATLPGTPTPDSSLLNSYSMQSAEQMVIDSFGNLYFADSTRGTIIRINPSGTYSDVATVTGAASIAISPDQTTLYVGTIQDTISKVTISTGAVTVIAGSVNNNGTSDNAIGTSAKFRNPRSLAVSPDGTKLYSGDSGGNNIRQIVLSGTYPVTTIAGSTAGGAGTTDSTTGTSAKFSAPRITISPDGTKLYVADYQGNKIRQVVLSGLYPVTTLAGTGTASSVDNITGTLATFNNPMYLAVSPDGTKLYVADYLGNKVRQVTLSGAYPVTTLAGSGAAATTDGTGTSAAFNTVKNIAISEDGTTLYVKELEPHNLRKIVISTGVVTTLPPLVSLTSFSGTNLTFYTWSSTDGTPGTAGTVTKKVERSTNNSTWTTLSTTFTGTQYADTGLTPGTRYYYRVSHTNQYTSLSGVQQYGPVGTTFEVSTPPNSVASMSLDTITISPTASSLTFKWTAPTVGVVDTYNVYLYNTDASGNPTTLNSSALGIPSSTLSASFGSLLSNQKYYAEVRTVTANGREGIGAVTTGSTLPGTFNITNATTTTSTVAMSYTQAGNTSVTYSATQAVWNGSSYGTPVTSTLTKGGAVLTATGLTAGTRYQFVITVTNSSGNSSPLTTVYSTRTPAPATPTASNFTSSSFDVTIASPAASTTGYKVELDVADTFDNIPTTTYVNCAGTCPATSVQSITQINGSALEPNLIYYVRVSATTSTGTIGDTSDWSDVSLTLTTATEPNAPTALTADTAKLVSTFPSGIVRDSYGNTYISASGSDGRQIFKVKPSGETVVLAGSTTQGFQDGTGANALFDDPEGMVLSPDQKILYVADSGNKRIRAIVIATGVVTTIAGNGTSTSVNGIGTAATFNLPYDVTISPDGRVLYVVELQGARVRAIPITANSGAVSTATTTTIAGGGAGTPNGIGVAALFVNPAGITISPNGTVLYVAESTGGNRIRGVQITANSTATSTVTTTTIAGGGATTPFSTAGSTEGIGSAALFNGINGITIDTNGTKLYVTDSNNHKVRAVTITANSTATSTVTTSTLAGSNQGTFDSATGTSAKFNNPQDITFNADKTKLFVADRGTAKLRSITLSSTAVSSVADYNTSVLNAGSIGLTWASSASGNSGTSAAQSFKVERATNSGFTANLVTLATNHDFNVFTDSTVAAGTTYYYRVSATNNVITPSYSAVSSTFSTTTPANAPTGVTVNGVNQNPDRLTVTWVAPATGSVSSYNVYLYETDSSGNPTTLRTSYSTPNSSTLTASFGSLPSNQKYYAEVRAVASSGIESDGISNQGSTVPAVFSITSATTTASTVVMTYVAQTGNNTVTYSATQAVWNGSSYGTPVASTLTNVGGVLTATGLASATRYQFVITTTNSGGNSTLTTVSSTRTAPPATPTADTFTSSSFNVNISRPSANTTGYKVEVDTVNTFATATVTYVNCSGTCPATSVQPITGLQANIIYYVRVSATIDSTVYPGSDWSAVSSTLTTATEPEAPTGVALNTTTLINDPRVPIQDAYGNTYIANYTGNNIIKVKPSGETVVIAGSGTASSVDGTGTGATIWGPQQMIFSPNKNVLYFVEQSGNKVRAVNISTGVVTTIAGSGTSASADGIGTAATFNGLTGVAISPDGTKLYVSEQSGNKIRGIQLTAANSTSVSTVATTTIAGSGTAGAAEGIGIAATFTNPRGLVVSPDGTKLYVVDGGNNKIRAIPLVAANSIATATATTTVIAGGSTANGSTSGSTEGIGMAGLFNVPYMAAISADGTKLYVSDINNNKIRVVTITANSGATSTVATTTLAGSGIAGSTDGTSGATAQFTLPRGVSLSADGSKLYVADTNNKFRQIVISTGVVTSLTSYATSVLNTGSIGLTWTAPTSGTTGTADTLNYKVERSLDGSTGWATLTSNNATTTYTDTTSLTAGTTYYYRVSATNTTITPNYGNVSSTFSATTSPNAVPAASVSVSSNSTDSVTATWNAPSTGGVSSYNVYLYNASSSTMPTTLVTSVNVPSGQPRTATFSSLTPDRFYIVEVRPVSSSGVEGDGVVGNGKTIPTAPTVTIGATTSDSIPITLSGLAGSQYIVQVSLNGSTWYDAVTSPATMTSQTGNIIAGYTNSGTVNLSGDTLYYVKAYTIGSVTAGGSTYGAPASANTKVAPITGLNITATSTTVSSSWTASTSTVTGYYASLYLYTGGTKGAQVGTTQAIPSGTNTATFTGLNSDAQYLVEVYAYNANGNSNLASSGIFTKVAPGTALALTSTSTSVVSTWTASTSTVTGYYASVYLYTGGTKGAQVGTTQTIPSGTNTATFTGLNSNARYLVEVYAYNGNGNSNLASTDITTKVAPVTALALTRNITALTASWTASTSTVTGYYASVYVYTGSVKGAQVGTTQTIPSGTNTATFTGLTASTLYLVEVYAYNANGNSTLASASATTYATMALSYADTIFTTGSNNEVLSPTRSGGDGTYTQSLTGTLPTGVTFSTSTGAFTGPATAGWSFKVASGANSISTMNGTTCVITTLGAVNCWGSNQYGAVDGTANNQTAPYTASVQTPVTSGATKVVTNGRTTCALVSGTVKCWGYNANGAVSGTANATTPFITGVSTPIAASATDFVMGGSSSGAQTFVCAIVTGTGVRCWGYNLYGAVSGAANATAPNATAVTTLAGTSGTTKIATNLSSASAHVCALNAGGAGIVKCWGYNQHAAVSGTANATSPYITGVSTLVAASATDVVTATQGSAAITCAIVTGTGVRCAGYNVAGVITGTTTTSTTGTALTTITGTSGATKVQLSGVYSACALVSGAVKCWGYNSAGQVNGTAQATPFITAVSTPIASSATDFEMTRDGSTNATVCAIVTGTGVRCWGFNQYGNANGGTVTAATPFAQAVTTISGTSGASSITLGDSTTSPACAVVSGAIQCWGYNRYGNVGSGSANGTSPYNSGSVSTALATGGTRVLVDALGNNVCAITTNYDVRCWGLNTSGGATGGANTTQQNSAFTVSGFGTTTGFPSGNLTIQLQDSLSNSTNTIITLSQD